MPIDDDHAGFLKECAIFNIPQGGVTPGEVSLQLAYNGGKTITMAASSPIAVYTSLGFLALTVTDKGTQSHQPIYHLGASQSFTLGNLDIDTVYMNDTAGTATSLNIQDESSGQIYADNAKFYVWSSDPVHQITINAQGAATIDGAASFTPAAGQGIEVTRISLNTWLTNQLVINDNIFNGLVPGAGVTITQDSQGRSIIGLSGSGATAASGYITRQNIQNSIAGDIHFTNNTDYYIPKCGNVTPDVNQCNNFQYFLDGNQHLGLKYIGAESGVFEITFQLDIIYSPANTNSASNNYKLSANLNLTGGPNGSFAPINIISGNNSGSNISFIVYPNYTATPTITFQVPLNPNDVIYPNIRNDGPSNNAALNAIILNTFTGVGKKVEDTGGLSAGVASYNGVTGNVTTSSSNNTISIIPSGSNFDLKATLPVGNGVPNVARLGGSDGISTLTALDSIYQATTPDVNGVITEVVRFNVTSDGSGNLVKVKITPPLTPNFSNSNNARVLNCSVVQTSLIGSAGSLGAGAINQLFADTTNQWIEADIEVANINTQYTVTLSYMCQIQ